MPSFSIIIPFKTGKDYLMQCLQSALSQDHDDFEVIILSDNTSNTDGSLDAVNQLNDPRVRIEGSDKTFNILENWDRIKNISRKEFMTILGYDDILDPHFLTAISQLIETDAGASLYHTHFNYIDSNGNIIGPCLPLPKKLTADEYLALTLQDKVSVMATGYVFRSADYDQVGGIPINYPNLIYADLCLFIELAKRSYMAVEPGRFFSFRLHQSTTKTSKDRILLSAFVIYLQYLHRLMKESTAFATTIQNWAPGFIAQTTRSLAHRLLRTAKKDRNGLEMKMIFDEIGKEAVSMNINYDPVSIPTIKTALLIDGNPVLSRLFLLFKRLYKKPVY